ncbi:hypothetical protein [Bacteriovorax sp. DB6_IX]|uniref:hypothetical protein n=1 Tax=Bacteriovorax sp. DB6_IX TaxID=1353530 RepID=UPI00038A08E7|nr:hypothetical protein [Bacteriovorax sp. DB6_IX]EQC51538.1 hypothetical protein M901_2580 [Bacteriovorax sp. DB6_IX]
MKKIIISLLTLNTMAIDFSNFGGIDIDHSPTWRDYRNSLRSEVGTCQIKLAEKEYTLNDGKKYEEALEFIKSFNPSLYARAQQAIENGELHIREFTDYIRQQYGIDKKTSALFIHEKNSIYINKSDELGLLTIFLYHELSHAFDEKIPLELKEVFELFDLYKTKYDELYEQALTRGYTPSSEVHFSEFLSSEEDSQLEDVYNAYNEVDSIARFRAERYAFNQQDLYVKYLIENYDCYGSYIEEHKKKNRLKLYENTPDSYIRSAYNL